MWKVSWHFAGSTLDISNCGIFTSELMSTPASAFHCRISSLVVLETKKEEEEKVSLYTLYSTYGGENGAEDPNLFLAAASKKGKSSSFGGTFFSARVSLRKSEGRRRHHHPRGDLSNFLFVERV